jgi:hypothetical protein
MSRKEKIIRFSAEASDDFCCAFAKLVEKNPELAVGMFTQTIIKIMSSCTLEIRRDIWNLIGDIEESLDEKDLDNSEKYLSFIMQNAYRVFKTVSKWN